MKKKHIKRFILGFISGVVLLPILAHAQTVNSSDFVQQAAIGGMFEIQSSVLALQRSQNPDVKKFAQMMVSDHTKIGAELKSSLPGGKNPETSLNVIVLPDALDREHADMVDELTNVPQIDFDKFYIRDQLDAHRQTVKLFSNYSRFGDETSLQAFSTANLPTLRSHLEAARQLQSQMHR